MPAYAGKWLRLIDSFPPSNFFALSASFPFLGRPRPHNSGEFQPPFLTTREPPKPPCTVWTPPLGTSCTSESPLHLHHPCRGRLCRCSLSAAWVEAPLSQPRRSPALLFQAYGAREPLICHMCSRFLLGSKYLASIYILLGGAADSTTQSSRLLMILLLVATQPYACTPPQDSPHLL